MFGKARELQGVWAMSRVDTEFDRTGASESAICRNDLIDRFMTHPDVSMTHQIAIDAPPDVVLDVAEHFDLQSIPAVHFLFRLRAVLLRIRPKSRPKIKALISETRNAGWIELAHAARSYRIMGAVTQPWLGDVGFKALTPEEFATFAAPGFVKVVWTLEAEPLRYRTTLFRTQTRVFGTDARARRRFLLYWTFAGPLVSLIRILALRAIRREAEKRLV
jgi:hypothetical protein